MLLLPLMPITTILRPGRLPHTLSLLHRALSLKKCRILVRLGAVLPPWVPSQLVPVWEHWKILQMPSPRMILSYKLIQRRQCLVTVP